MTKRHDRPLTLEELAQVKDEDIDFSDIPERGETFWKNARLVELDHTQSVTLRVKKSVLETYKAIGKGCQTRMNAVLESFARNLKK